ncbi:uncharacterized protein LOC112590994 [Melanaphis sacchari]|uniref:uncharacterized protein LOC112590994 n=1 Tax=Melanaphis sacchari TaxID=742174 RepID=UPI000DC13A1C|nr:uncharacterized protein LOC112590994 [Melanaphis sacchari]
MSEISSLIKFRGQLKASVTRFLNFVTKENVDVNEVHVRKEKIEGIWSEYERIQSAIEETEGVEMNEQDKYREEFEDMFFKAVGIAKKLTEPVVNKKEAQPYHGIDEDRTCERNDRSIEMISDSKNNGRQISRPPIRLSALNVPTFSGEYNEWATFHDIFTSLIHNNADLSPVEKYSNKKVLVQTHVKSMFELEPVTSESSARLRQFTDALTSHMSALETLGHMPSNWGPLLVHLIVTKLDKNSRREWETNAPKEEVAPVEVIIEFLEARFKILEAIETCKNINNRQGAYKFNNHNKQFNERSSSLVIGNNKGCYICQAPHTIYKCPIFIALPVTERIKKVAEMKLCKLCLRQHAPKKCNSKNCFTCSKPHNTMLHLSNNSELRKSEAEKPSEDQETASAISVHVAANSSDQVLLSTAEVWVQNESGESQIGRVLLDSGSQCNFITESMAQILKLKKTRVQHTVLGIGGKSQYVKAAVVVTIRSRINNYSLTCSCLVVPKITNALPSVNIGGVCIVPSNIELADTSFKIPKKIDLLLGACHFFEILCKQKIKPTINGPIFQETQLGWVVSGLVTSKCADNKHNNINCHTATLVDEDRSARLEIMVSKFWRTEEFEAAVPYTKEEKKCVDHFESTVNRKENGRFIVHLPLKNDANIKIGPSYEIAKRRFLALERRLQHDVKLKQDYTTFMREYETLGHMELVKNEEKFGETCYLPHHAVKNENSKTTKLRVVFDASCKTESGYSLNDTLLKGPVIQDELLYIISRFRTHKFVLTADIQKMYRQVLVTKQDSEKQRILWRADPSLPIQIYRLTTLTYGTVPASFLATACLRKISEQETSYLKACEAIRNDFYMDDFLSGAETIEEAIKLRDEVILIMKKAGMTLRKWSSNEPSIVSCISDKEKSNGCIFEEESITKILGLYWNANGDVLQYKVKEYNENTTISKRHILAETAAIFDPMGLVGPIIVQAKLIIQSLWQIRIGWDDPLPDHIRIEWVKYRKSLSMLNKLTIPRNIGGSQKLTNIQIHGFADASIKCYGACIFLRSTNEQGEHTAKLICAKSKVTPLKVISLPRLELCAALLLARLVSRIVPKLKLNIAKKYFWSDSKIALSWIASPSTKWKTFVAHRIGEIQELSNITDWSYVKSSENPADIISRGCDAEQISGMNLWWDGPEWLKNNTEDWPVTGKTSQNDNIEMLPESKTIRNIALVATGEFILFERYSSLNKILRIAAYWLRFRDFLVKKSSASVGPLKPEDLERANIGLIKNREHLRCMHGGPLAILALVRLYYWPLKARNIARATVHKCVTCFKQKPVFVEPIMGDLPRERIEPSRPFKVSGIDFAGPLLIKDSLKKRASLTKGYVCIFVCFATKAIHIDEIQKQTANDGVEWRFIPPRSPHFGGLWEAAVKSMKNLIGKVLGESHLTYEELNTILTRVEACLNSRPLTEMSSDPSDLTYLTPAHFLIGESLMAVPERDESTMPANRLDRWRRIRQYSQILWKRWSHEYLNQLQDGYCRSTTERTE